MRKSTWSASDDGRRIEEPLDINQLNQQVHSIQQRIRARRLSEEMSPASGMFGPDRRWKPRLPGSLGGKERAYVAALQSIKQQVRARRLSLEEMLRPPSGMYGPDGPQKPRLPGSLVGKERAYVAALQSGGPEQISATRAALATAIDALLDADRDRLSGLDGLPEQRREREFLRRRVKSLQERRDALSNADQYPAPAARARATPEARGPVADDGATPSIAPAMDVTEEQVIASVACPHLGCNAKRGQRCKHKGGRTFRGTLTHRGRWLKLERDLRTGRAVFPPAS
jgi:hypothetical protein